MDDDSHKENRDTYAAIVVAVPDEYFSDNDELCYRAGKFICCRLQSHLENDGHTINDWVKDGCEEDWGFYLESECRAETFGYAISFWPAPQGCTQNLMVIQYFLKQSFFKSLFQRPQPLSHSHHLHSTISSFSSRFTSSRMLTESEFQAEY